MITINQIKELEKRIELAINLIEELKRENTGLEDELITAKERIGELEEELSSFVSDQDAIEKGIIGALDRLEKGVSNNEESTPPTHPMKVASPTPAVEKKESSSSPKELAPEEDLDLF